MQLVIPLVVAAILGSKLSHILESGHNIHVEVTKRAFYCGLASLG
jgi:hypothetical protein